MGYLYLMGIYTYGIFVFTEYLNLCIFVFRSKIFFYDISISGGRRGSLFAPKFFSSIFRFLEIAKVKGRCQRYQRAFSLFGTKKFSISRFLEVAQVKVRCQRYQPGSLNSVRAFSFSGPKFFSSISRFTGCRKGYWKVSTVLTRCPEKCARIFVFCSKKFFFDISISGCRCRSGERELSTVPLRFPEQYAGIFIFLSKKFFLDMSIFECRSGEWEVSTVLSRFPELYASIFVSWS